MPAFNQFTKEVGQNSRMKFEYMIWGEDIIEILGEYWKFSKETKVSLSKPHITSDGSKDVDWG